MERDAQRFWESKSRYLPEFAHWRSAGRFGNDARWLAWGESHLAIYREFCSMLQRPPHVERMLEWGSGGGAIALQFAPLCREYVGVEITKSNLDECSGMLANAGIHNFHPVLIRTEDPEAVYAAIPNGCDVFLSIGVFQTLPTPEYGLRILRIAHSILAPGGIAIVQTKYVTGSWVSKPKRFGYSRNFPILTAYGIDEFWQEAQGIGFHPHCIKLIPRHPATGDGDYAYFLLEKGADGSHGKTLLH